MSPSTVSVLFHFLSIALPNDPNDRSSVCSHGYLLLSSDESINFTLAPRELRNKIKRIIILKIKQLTFWSHE